MTTSSNNVLELAAQAHHAWPKLKLQAPRWNRPARSSFALSRCASLPMNFKDT